MDDYIEKAVERALSDDHTVPGCEGSKDMPQADNVSSIYDQDNGKLYWIKKFYFLWLQKTRFILFIYLH